MKFPQQKTAPRHLSATLNYEIIYTRGISAGYIGKVTTLPFPTATLPYWGPSITVAVSPSINVNVMGELQSVATVKIVVSICVVGPSEGTIAVVGRDEG